MGEFARVRIQEVNDGPLFRRHGRRQSRPGRRSRPSSVTFRGSRGRPLACAAVAVLLTGGLVPLAIPAAAHGEEFVPLTVSDYEFHSSASLPAAALSLTILDMDPDTIECTVSMGMATTYYRSSIGPINTLTQNGMPRGYGYGWSNGPKAEVLGVGTNTVVELLEETWYETLGMRGGMAKRVTYPPIAFENLDLRGDITFSMASANLHPYWDPANLATGPDSMLMTLHCTEAVEILFHASRQALLHSQATFDSSLLYIELAHYGNVVMGAESQRTFEGERVEISAGPGRIEPQPLWEGALQVDGPGGHHEWDFFTDDWYWRRTGEPGTNTFRLDRRAIGTSVSQQFWLLAVGWQPVQDLTAVFDLPGFSGEAPTGGLSSSALDASR